MKKIYIAGPMRGHPDYNFPAFHEADDLLTLHGWITINPAELDADFDTDRHHETITRKELEDFIVRDMHLIMDVDAICLLQGWETSKGVAVEVAVANYLSIPIYSLSGALKVRLDHD